MSDLDISELAEADLIALRDRLQVNLVEGELTVRAIEDQLVRIARQRRLLTAPAA